AAGLQPPADEVAAGILRPALVDAAAMIAAEEACRAGLHLVSLDHSDDPTVATCGAFTARASMRGGDRDHRAAAPLVLLAASARAEIVTPGLHVPVYSAHPRELRSCTRNSAAPSDRLPRRPVLAHSEHQHARGEDAGLALGARFRRDSVPGRHPRVAL